MEKRWVYRPKADQALVDKLAEDVQIDGVLARLLIARGVSTYADARIFFRPNLNQLHDPFLMKDMQKAVDIIETAMSDNEAILIYGDYDVDGITAVALLYKFLKHYHERMGTTFLIATKKDMVYRCKAIDWAVENNYKLIITLDCGITAVEQVAYANSLGLQVIITDHHLPADLPEAAAILNPKQHDCPYPFKELSDVALALNWRKLLVKKTNLISRCSCSSSIRWR